jgi:hypothetical protein
MRKTNGLTEMLLAARCSQNPSDLGLDLKSIPHENVPLPKTLEGASRDELCPTHSLHRWQDITRQDLINRLMGRIIPTGKDDHHVQIRNTPSGVVALCLNDGRQRMTHPTPLRIARPIDPSSRAVVATVASHSLRSMRNIGRPISRIAPKKSRR